MATETREPDPTEPQAAGGSAAPRAVTAGPVREGSSVAAAGEPRPATPAAAGPPLHTRLSATWTGVVVGLLVLVLLIAFIAQNTQRSTVHFFGLDGTAPTAVVLLIASVAGALVVVGIAMARLLQLRVSGRRSAPSSPPRAGREREPVPGSSGTHD